jgi:hypothetical protein
MPSNKDLPDNIIISFITKYIFENVDMNKIKNDDIYNAFKSDLHLKTYNKKQFINIITNNYKLDSTRKIIILQEEKEEKTHDKKQAQLIKEWLECIQTAIDNNFIIST